MAMPVILSGASCRWTWVDDADYDLVTGREWRIHSGGYSVAVIEGKITYMHRFILGAERGQIVDHLNGDRLDNRRSNLRLGNYSLNNLNSVRRATSQFPGVWANGKGFQSQINFRGRRYNLGQFADEQLAYNAWAAKYAELYGTPAPTPADLTRKVVAA